MALLDKIVVGWDSIEPILIACVACEKNLILRGRHGASKTAVAKIIAESLGKNHRHYDATKADLITLAGIPNPKALSDIEKPRLEFAKHDQTVWDADYISVDELTRAPREAQNLWLSILEEKTLQGIALKYKTAIATMNPETYAATNRIDEALFDRFYAVIDVPDILKTGNAKENILEMLQMTRQGKVVRDPVQIQILGKAIGEIKDTFEAFKNDESLTAPIEKYVATFFTELANGFKGYISGRKLDHLRECVYACAAYFKVIESLGCKVPAPDGLVAHGAQFAATYVVGTALEIPPSTVLACHQKAVKEIKGLSGSASDKIRKEIYAAKTVSNKVAVMNKYLKEISALPPSEMHSVVSIVTNMVAATTFDDGSDKKQSALFIANVVDEMQGFLSNMKALKNPIAKATAASVSGALLSESMQQLNACMMSLKPLFQQSKVINEASYNKLAGKDIGNIFEKLFNTGFKNSMTETVTKFFAEIEKLA
jgi:MoxR-like ATPase